MFNRYAIDLLKGLYITSLNYGLELNHEAFVEAPSTKLSGNEDIEYEWEIEEREILEMLKEVK